MGESIKRRAVISHMRRRAAKREAAAECRINKLHRAEIPAAEEYSGKSRVLTEDSVRDESIREGGGASDLTVRERVTCSAPGPYETEAALFRPHSIEGLSADSRMFTALKHQATLVVCVLSLASVAMASLGAFILRSFRSELVPYVVSVDSHGVVLKGSTMTARDELPENIVTAQLCDFITGLRMVSKDPVLQKQAVMKAYAFAEPGGKVSSLLNTFYGEQNPFERSEKGEIRVSVSNAIMTDHHTIQIDWTETDVAFSGRNVSKKFRAQLRYGFSDMRNVKDEMLLLNPLGICVSDLVISPVIAGNEKV